MEKEEKEEEKEEEKQEEEREWRKNMKHSSIHLDSWVVTLVPCGLVSAASIASPQVYFLCVSAFIRASSLVALSVAEPSSVFFLYTWQLSAWS